MAATVSLSDFQLVDDPLETSMPKTPEAETRPAAKKPVTQRPASTSSGWDATDLALIGVFAALIAASIIVPPIPAGVALGVPITLQTMVITLSGLVLGAGRAAAATGLYVLLGLVGLPIFSGFRAGPGVLAGGSAGYILAFAVFAGVVGWLAQIVVRRTGRAHGLWFTGCAFVGLLVSHVSGIIGMMINGKLSLEAAVLADLIFVPGDVIKCIIAVVISISIHRAFPDILLRRRK